jgi:hypothetical protein
MGELNVGQIVTEAKVDDDGEVGGRVGEKRPPMWEQRTLFRMLREQVGCEAMRTAAFGNDD